VPPEEVERILPFVRTRHLDYGEAFVEDEAVLAWKIPNSHASGDSSSIIRSSFAASTPDPARSFRATGCAGHQVALDLLG
jgi:hypothetical protein